MPDTPVLPPPPTAAAAVSDARPTRATSLRRYLARIIFLAAGPLVLLAGVMAAIQVARASRSLEAEASALAQAVADRVDRDTSTRLNGLVLLANARSPFDPAEPARGYELLQSFRRVFGEHVLVADRNGQMLLNTRVPLGSALPQLPVPRGRSAVAEALATGKPAISDLVRGPISASPLVALCVPVQRDGVVQAFVISTLEQAFLKGRIQAAKPPAGWSVRMLDSLGEVMAQDGPDWAVDTQGRVFHVALAAAPWRVEVHVPAAAHWQPVARAAVLPLLALLLATVAGALGGGAAAARLQKALRALGGGSATGSHTPTGIAEVDSLSAQLAAAEAGLRDSVDSYRLMFDANPHPMWVADVASLRFLAVNAAAIRHYGYSREQFLAMTLADIRPQEDVVPLKATIGARTDAAPGAASVGTWSHRLKDGSLIRVEVTRSRITFEGHEATLVLAVDVSERESLTTERMAADKSAQRALQQLRDVMSRVGDGFVAFDRDFVLTYANERAATLVDLPSPAVMVGRRKADLLPDRTDSPFQMALARALATQEPQFLETLFEPTGRWLENRIYPSPDGVSVYFTDITDRRRTQDALAKSERDFRVLSEQIPAIVYRLQLATGQMDFVTPRIQDLGYTPAEWVERPGRLWEAMHVEDRPVVEALVRQALQSQQQVLHLSYRLRDSQGQWHHMDDHAAIIRPEDGQPPFLLGVNLDVSDAHAATAALRRSELQFRRLAEQVPAIIYRTMVRGDGPALYVSPHIASLGYTAQQWTSAEGPNWNGVVHPEDMLRIGAQLANLAAEPAEMALEYRLRDAWGRWRHFIDHARVVEGDVDAAGMQLQGVMVEITFLKLTEQALRQAEADQRSLFEALADGVLVLDAEHQVIDANASAAALLGYPREELLHKQLRELLPEHERAHVPDEIAALLATPDARLAQWDSRRRDGTVFPTEVSVRPAGGGRYVEVFRDVTDRLAAEQVRINYQRDLSNLTHRLMSQERETSRHLAQTLHDHLGQSLAVSRLRMDAATVAQGHLMPEPLKNEWARVGQSLDQAIADVRLVLGDLRPPMLEEQGLLAALDNETRVRSLDAPGLDVLMEVDDTLAGTRWPADVEYCAFMVAREAIVNVQLHAGASLVRVILAGDVHRLDLQVLDDGRGIAEDMRLGRPGHLGLVGMRERALAIGADFSVERAAEGGTCVSLQWQEAAR